MQATCHAAEPWAAVGNLIILTPAALTHRAFGRQARPTLLPAVDSSTVMQDHPGCSVGDGCKNYSYSNWSGLKSLTAVWEPSEAHGAELTSQTSSESHKTHKK